MQFSAKQLNKLENNLCYLSKINFNCFEFSVAFSSPYTVLKVIDWFD